MLVDKILLKNDINKQTIYLTKYHDLTIVKSEKHVRRKPYIDCGYKIYFEPSCW